MTSVRSYPPTSIVGFIAYQVATLGDDIARATIRAEAKVDDAIATEALAWVRANPLPEVPATANGKGSSSHAPAAPLFNAEQIQFGRFMRSDPPDRRWLIRQFLPLEITGLVAAMGGAGKSMLLYQLAFCVAGGLSFLGMKIGEVGGVLYMGAEDDEGELHRRGLRILEYVEGEGPIDRGALGERLHVVSRVADNNLLTARHDGEVARTQLVDRLIEAASTIPHLKLIVLDPASRFRGGKANEEEDATRFVEALESVRMATGACVIASVHVNKASMRDAGESGQEIVRGSTALVDSARWCATLQYLRKDSADAYGVDPDEVKHYVRAELVKSNYTAPWPGLWLHRQPEGVLVPTVLEKTGVSKAQDRADAQYNDVLARIVDLLGSEGPITPRRLETDFSGQAGVLGAGQKTVRSVVVRAIQEGALVEQDNIGKGGGRTVNLPGGTP